MRVFLTGGTGFIGRALTRQLLARGWSVTALVRRPDSAEAREIAAKGAILASGDVTDPDSMRKPMTGADIVIHNAGVYEFGVTGAGRERMRAINVDGTANTIGLAHESKIGRIVHVSSIVALGTTTDVADESHVPTLPLCTWYEQTKAKAHEIALEFQRRGAPVVIACPAGVMGPGDHSGLGYLMRMYLRGMLPPFLFGSDGTRAHVHVDDCAEAIALVAEKGRPGESYILSGGTLRHGDTVALWRQAPGGLPHVGDMPRPVAHIFCALAEPVQRLLGLPMVLNREFVHAAHSHWAYSGAKAERELGARFRPVEQVVLDTLWAEHALLKRKKA